jgi:hypothetical protein
MKNSLKSIAFVFAMPVLLVYCFQLEVVKLDKKVVRGPAVVSVNR